MNNKQSLWFLVEADGRSRQIINGVVTSLNKPTPLPQAPIGHYDIQILWERSEDYWGIVRNFSLPLGFVLTAAKIIRNDAYKFNFDRELYLIIKFLTCEVTTTEFSLYYKHLYKGRLDFSTIEDLPGDQRVNMNIMEGGVYQLLKANENTDFLIPFDNDAVLVKMDGTKIEGRYSSIISNGVFTNDTLYFKNHLVELILVQSELAFVGSVKGVQRLQVSNNNSLIQDTQGWFFKSTVDGDVELSYNMDVRVEYTPAAPAINPAGVFRIAVRRINSTGFGDNIHVLLEKNAGSELVPGTYHLEDTVTLSVNEGDELYLFTFFTVEGSTGDAQIRCTYDTTEDTLFNLRFFYRHPTTYVFGFYIYDLFKKLCVKLGMTADKAVSDLLQASTLVITSGDGLRGIPDTGVKTSVKDFFKAVDVMLFAGMGIEGDTLRIESRTYFFKTTGETALGNVRDMKITAAVDLLFSSLKIGHADQEVDDVNGRYSFNGYHIYTSPVKTGGGKQLDLQSHYKADPFETETLRRNTEGQTTTDTIQDNSPFVLDVVPAAPNSNVIPVVLYGFYEATSRFYYGVISFEFAVGQVIAISGTSSNNVTGTILAQGHEPLVGSYVVLSASLTDETGSNATVTIVKGMVVELDRSVVPDSGVPDPATVFNVRLRPSALLEKHYRWLRGCLYNYTGVLKFEQANRNPDLVVNGLKDGRDVNIANMGERMFKPYYFEFTTIVPIALPDTIESDANTPFEATWDGNDFGGFMFLSGIAPNSREPQMFKLLSWPDNDLTKLIV